MLRAAQAQQKALAQKRWAHLRACMQQYHTIRFLQKEANMRANRTQSGRIERQASSVLDWANFKKCWSDTAGEGPSADELDSVQKQARTAALTMLTMLLVDGVPEGILMGFMAAAGNLGVTFILSLSIANFPEAFAGGVLMQEGRFSKVEIIGAWGGLAILVSLLAGVSCYLLLKLNPGYSGGHETPFAIQILIALMEGLAGGAMISGIAACMLPEAYERRDKKAAIHKTGGFLCTVGFLLSVAIKVCLG